MTFRSLACIVPSSLAPRPASPSGCPVNGQVSVASMTDSDQIRNAIGRYSQLIDERRYDDLAEVAASDAVFDVLGQQVRGVEAIANFFASRAVPDRSGKHVTTNVVIEV